MSNIKDGAVIRLSDPAKHRFIDTNIQRLFDWPEYLDVYDYVSRVGRESGIIKFRHLLTISESEFHQRFPTTPQIWAKFCDALRFAGFSFQQTGAVANDNCAEEFELAT